MRRCLAVFLAVVLAGACVENAKIPTVPEQLVTMQVAASQIELPRGQSTTLTVSLTNTRDGPVQLVFPTTCQVVLFIKDVNNRIVARKRTDDCATVPSVIVLQPAQTTTFPFTWSGESELGPPGSGSPVPAGSYFASAEMRADGYTGFAYPILLTLQD